MKIAMLILCHKELEQIKLFISAMRNSNITFFLHVDKKSNIKITELEQENVIIIPNQERINVQWAQISQVDAELVLLKEAINTGYFDYFWLCSGQDFPIKNVNYILNKLSQNMTVNYLNLFNTFNYNLGKNNKYDKRNQIQFANWMINRKLIFRLLKRMYIELTGGYNRTFNLCKRKNVTGLKFYFGSQWWCLNSSMVYWIMEYINQNPMYYKYYSKCLCPDESFFHTLVMNSPYKETVQDYLHYIDWSEGKHSPKTLTKNDLPSLLKSDKLMARKFDVRVDCDVIQEILKGICYEETQKV